MIQQGYKLELEGGGGVPTFELENYPMTPEQGEALSRILEDIDAVIMPGITHWNHPRFHGYFSITGSGPGILGESLAAAIASGQYNAPGIGYTIMIEPETLRIARSDTDDITVILAFVERVKKYSFVRFATIEETAQAWVAAGGVPIQIEQ